MLTKNLQYYAVDWESFEVQQYPTHDNMKQYVEALCSSARFRITGGVLLEHDLAWDRGGDSTPETMRRYYFLQSQDVDPPLPTKSERILSWSHATDVGALWNMLKNRDMLPMNAHGVEKFGCNIVYALGHEVSGSEIDEYNISRVICSPQREEFGGHRRQW